MTPKTKAFNSWSLDYHDYDPNKEKSRESLLTVGNGYLGSRGAMEEIKASETNYPGTYVAGLYNRLKSQVSDRLIENEDLVNIPNWTHINFRINKENWFTPNDFEILSIYRNVNFKNGVFSKEMVVKDTNGKETKISTRRVASMKNPHLLTLEYKITPLNYSGEIDIISEIDGNIINDGVARYRSLNQNHLAPHSQGIENDYSWLMVKTTQSDIKIAEAVKHSYIINGSAAKPKESQNAGPGVISTKISVPAQNNDEICVQKTVSVYTSKTDDVSNPLQSAIKEIKNAGVFDKIVTESEEAWKKIWERIDIKITGDAKSQMLIRLHLYHLMIAASPNNENIDAGIAARGLHGEAYRGHIFWDELYIMPLYDLFLPEVAKSILNYRYKRLDKAREYAKEYGYKGAMFPWQSGSDGREETQIVHLNPVSGKWGDDYSSLQRHISIAIAYNIWGYFQITNDVQFMEEKGAEMFLEICRFWASKAKYEKENGKYNITKVMGPDEFHEQHYASPEGGVKNNAYTNIMVAWVFNQAKNILSGISDEAKQKINKKINLSSEETEEWKKISENLNIPVSEEGIIEQFEGYFELKELDWDAYRKKYKNIYRLDRILKAEGKSPDDYKLAKQADTLMTFYNIDEEIVRDILEKSDINVPDDYLRKNYDYYLSRTSHGSTLSRVVHAYMAHLFGNKEETETLYFEALQSDFTDIQGGTTAEGIHAGVMAGTALMAITTFAGVNFKKNLLEINPSLPENWERLEFNFLFKNNAYFFNITKSEIEIEIKNENSEDVSILFSNKKIILPANKKNVINY